MAALATLTLFVAVRHWNSWFDGMVFMNTPQNYPMQTFLRSIVILPDTSMRKSLTIAEVQELAHISERTVKSAQIFIGALPILVVYPYLQRYFVKGMVLGPIVSTIGWTVPAIVSGETITAIVLNLPTTGPLTSRTSQKNNRD